MVKLQVSFLVPEDFAKVTLIPFIIHSGDGGTKQVGKQSL